MVKLKIKKNPRIYKVGIKNDILIRDFGTIKLNNNEQITFLFGKQKYDFTQKEWGFYISQSINERVKNENFKIVLVKNQYSKYYLLSVSMSKIKEFRKYCKKEKQKVINWFNAKNT